MAQGTPVSERQDQSVTARHGAPDPVKLLDIAMLVMPGGQERTQEEYRALLAQTGFRLARVVPTNSPVSVVEGIPV